MENSEEVKEPEGTVDSVVFEKTRGRSFISDPANSDAFTQAGEYGWVAKAVVAYNIIFETEDELRNFYKFTRLLKKEYPTVRTIGSRIDRYLVDNALEVLSAKHDKPKVKVSKPKKQRVLPVGHEPVEGDAVKEPSE